MRPRVRPIISICAICSVSFEPQYLGQYCCSVKCGGKFCKRNHKLPEPNVKCAWCGKEFYKNTYSLRNSKSGLYFCSRKHKDEAQRIGGISEIFPQFYSKTIENADLGTIRSHRINLGMLKSCARCGYTKFPAILHTHHKDRNRNNNLWSNLEDLCPNCHEEEHYTSGDGKWKVSDAGDREIKVVS